MNHHQSEEHTCKGCALYIDENDVVDSEIDYEDDVCYLVYAGEEAGCPCRSCIVKMMCQDTCKARTEFTKEIKKYWP